MLCVLYIMYVLYNVCALYFPIFMDSTQVSHMIIHLLCCAIL